VEKAEKQYPSHCVVLKMSGAWKVRTSGNWRKGWLRQGLVKVGEQYSNKTLLQVYVARQWPLLYLELI
jgi:hypothetical protein